MRSKFLKPLAEARSLYAGFCSKLAVNFCAGLLCAGDLLAQSPQAMLEDAEKSYHQLLVTDQLTKQTDQPFVFAHIEAAGLGKISQLDIRVVLVQLVQSSGANDHLTLLQAQPNGRQSVIGVLEGNWSLTDLQAEVAQTLPDAIHEGVFQYPIFIQKGASLYVDSRTPLLLDRTNGVFVANFGSLFLHGTEVKSVGAINAGSRDFAPFIVTSGSGLIAIEDTRVSGLGFGRNPNFSGVTIGSRGLYRSEQPVMIRNSVFRDLVSVTLQNGIGADISHNQFLNARGDALSIRNSNAVAIKENLFLDSNGGDALRISNRSKDISIHDNAIYKTGGHGIHIRDGSQNLSLANNLIWQAGRSALSVQRADCVAIEGLHALAARQKAVVLRSVRASSIGASMIVGARQSGLSISDAPEGSFTRVYSTVFAANRVGLSTASPAMLQLQGNDFSNQFPRFIEGDLAFETPALAADLKGRTTLTFAAGGVSDQYLPPLACSIEVKG